MRLVVHEVKQRASLMAECCDLAEKRVSIEDRDAAGQFEESDRLVDPPPLRLGMASCVIGSLASQDRSL